MQCDRWEKRWSYEKLEMKTKQIFGKTFQKKVRGLGTFGCLNSRRIWRKPAACKLQDHHERQRELMQSNRWEKRWSYEKLEMKTKQSFGKTFQKKVRGVGILFVA